MTERDIHSEMEDEGIPDLQDGYPEQYWAEDPQRAPVPGDRPIAVDDFGTTAEEQSEGESLDGRLSREEPDVGEPSAANTTAAGTGRLVQQDEGVRTDIESQEIATDVGQDTGGFTAEESAMRVEDEG
ncbi:MAG TPA: DUF5709 domain-containing protein [Actinoallomurus sp.]|jgi:hypothetical protein